MHLPAPAPKGIPTDPFRDVSKHQYTNSFNQTEIIYPASAKGYCGPPEWSEALSEFWRGARIEYETAWANDANCSDATVSAMAAGPRVLIGHQKRLSSRRVDSFATTFLSGDKEFATFDSRGPANGIFSPYGSLEVDVARSHRHVISLRSWTPGSSRTAQANKYIRIAAPILALQGQACACQ